MLLIVTIISVLIFSACGDDLLDNGFAPKNIYGMDLQFNGSSYHIFELIKIDGTTGKSFTIDWLNKPFDLILPE